MPKLLRPAAPRLIRSHPLAVGLSDAVLLNGDRGWNYANEALQPVFAGSMAAEWTADSPGSRASGGTNYVTLASLYNIAAGSFTVSMLWKPVSNTGQFSGGLEKSNGGSRELAFFWNYDFNLGSISYYTIGTSLSGDVNYPLGMVNGGTYRLTVTRDAANLISFYANGFLVSSATFSGTTAVSGSAWNLGRNASGGGQNNAVYGDLFVWPARCLSADEVMQHAAEPWAMLRPSRRLLKNSLIAYTMTASAGSFALTGQAVALRAARKLALAQGSFTLTGQAVALRAARKLVLAQGSFTLTGQAVALRAARKLALAQGSFTLTGQAVALRAARKLALAQGSFALTGHAITFTYSGGAYSLTLDAGIFALTGQTVGLRATRRLALNRGVFTLTGQSVVLQADVFVSQQGFVIMSVTATIGQIVLVSDGPAAQIVDVTEQQSRT